MQLILTGMFGGEIWYGVDHDWCVWGEISYGADPDWCQWGEICKPS